MFSVRNWRKKAHKSPFYRPHHQKKKRTNEKENNTKIQRRSPFFFQQQQTTAGSLNFLISQSQLFPTRFLGIVHHRKSLTSHRNSFLHISPIDSHRQTKISNGLISKFPRICYVRISAQVEENFLRGTF